MSAHPTQTRSSLLAELDHLNAAQLRRLLVEQLTRQKLGLYWEADSIDRDRALNAQVVLPRVVPALCHQAAHNNPANPAEPFKNLIIEGDNFDSLRLLKATHSGKIRVIYIDPPYNTGTKTGSTTTATSARTTGGGIRCGLSFCFNASRSRATC